MRRGQEEDKIPHFPCGEVCLWASPVVIRFRWWLKVETISWHEILRIGCLGLPLRMGFRPLKWRICQSAADGCLSVEAFRSETTGGVRTRSSSVLTPREWLWTQICYWDVGISAQFSLLPPLLLLYTQMGMLRDWLLNYQAKNAIEPCNFIQ